MRRFAPVLAAAALAACGAPEEVDAEGPVPVTNEIPDVVVDVDKQPPPVVSGTPEDLAEDYRSPMRLVGNEPFWGVTIDDKIVLRRMDHPTLEATNAGPTLNGDVAMWNARDFTIRLSPGECSDGMSNNRYPYEATVAVQGEVLRGCAAPVAEWPTGEG